MFSQLSIPAVLLHAFGATASWTAYQEYQASLPKNCTKSPSKRPELSYEPNAPFLDLPASPSRNRTCFVKSHDDLTTDDSEYILSALHECNHGGQVVFPQGTTCVVGTALDLQFLKHVDIDIQSYIQFTNDTDYWQENAFYQTFQNATTFFQLGGEDVNVYGGGMLDGNGQVWSVHPMHIHSSLSANTPKVRCVRRRHLHPSPDLIRNDWPQVRNHRGHQLEVFTAVVQPRGELDRCCV